MASLSKQDLEKLAHLAALDLSSEELVALRGDLEQILEYVRKLEGLDTRGVEPLSHPTVNLLRDRPDIPRKLLEPEAVLANAPAIAEGMFKVPPVLDGEE